MKQFYRTRNNALGHQHQRYTRRARAQAKVIRDTSKQSALRLGLVGLLALSLMALITSWAKATEVQEIVTPKGIKAWLVEDNTVPLIAVNFSFSGGASQDDDAKLGTATMLTSLLDEGAGDMSSSDFQTALEENAIKLSFDTGRDRFYGSLRTLTPTTDKAFDLLSLALQKPTFDADPIERMRAQWLTQARRAETNPNSILSMRFNSEAYPDHPYGRSSKGSVATLEAITKDDLAKLHRAIFTRDDLIIGVVGSIDAKTLAPLLDKAFAPLPEKGDLKPVVDITFAKTGELHIPFNAPQTAIRFGAPGIERKDKDFYAAYIVNHILGGGSFSSRLYNEVREKRGLAYGVYSYLIDQNHSSQFGGGMSTRTDNADQAVKLLKSEIARMSIDGPTAEELANAKKFLIGSYPLRFDSSSKIARQLVALQDEGLGADYFDKRNSYIEAVTLEDAKRVAKKLLKPEKLFIVTVGQKTQTAKAETN